MGGAYTRSASGKPSANWVIRDGPVLANENTEISGSLVDAEKVGKEGGNAE